MIRKLIIIVTIFFLFTSCGVQPIENYEGGVVCEKWKTPVGNCRLFIKVHKEGKYRYTTISVLSFDYDRYNVGDTIK